MSVHNSFTSKPIQRKPTNAFRTRLDTSIGCFYILLLVVSTNLHPAIINSRNIHTTSKVYDIDI